MKKIFFFILLTIGLSTITLAQAQDSTKNAGLRFSLLTCDAGKDLYTIWGHTALRVTDSINHADIVYNYGSFDFNEPNFIAKFLKGDLRYFISADTYQNFLYEYEYFGRDVHEQILNISAIEKQQWQQDLLLNMIGDNRFYLYNFITDNCTTRIKDGLFKHSQLNNNSIHIQSFRAEVVEAPYKGGLPWVGLGIDLLLGAVADKKPNLFQEAFLPALLFNKLALNKQLVSYTGHVKYNQQVVEKSLSPIFILLLVLAIYLFTSNWNSYFTQKVATILDISFLTVLGLGGLIVFYMSQISLHTACHENYNLLWMHPLYLLALPIYFISNKWTGILGWIFFVIIILLMLSSYWIPQYFSNSTLVLMTIALFLNMRLIKRGRYAQYQ
jgi:hypothetical protein